MTRALVLCGPTSSGKSADALAVARALNGEIVNADSRQIYRGMRIGTGMPPPDALEQVPHHLYAFVEPSERYSAARFVEDARPIIDAIEARQRLPIVVGGTGFYIEALLGTMKLDRPPPNDELRTRLRNEAKIHPPQVLWDWLAARNPQLASEVRPGDSYRILRALESALSTERIPVSSSARELNVVTIVMCVAREVLRQRIAARVEQMFRDGIIAEALAVRAKAPSAPALSGLGYAEALAFADGAATYQEAVASTILRTRAYAKRQQTWFRRMQRVFEIDAADSNEAVSVITAIAREKLLAA